MKNILKLSAFLVFVSLIFPVNDLSAQLVGPVVSLQGNVFNQVTREPVTVYLWVLDENGERVNATRSNSAENGYYYLTGLKPGNKYTVLLRSRDYLIEKHEIELAKSNRYQEISKDFLVKPKKKDAWIKVPVPPYELNKSKLRFGHEYILDDMKGALKENPSVKVEIKSYPDNNNNPQENIELTQERAESLKEYFVESGIDESRITISGSQQTDPKNPPPQEKSAKGKRYIGPSYLIVKDFDTKGTN